MTANIDRRSLLGAGVAGVAAAGLGTGAMAKTMLAKGVRKRDFAGAVAAMRKVVGDEWVFAETDAVTPWKKSYTPDPYGKHVPVGAVCPQSVDEVLGDRLALALPHLLRPRRRPWRRRCP